MYYLNNISQIGSIAVVPSWVDESFAVILALDRLSSETDFLQGGTSLNQMTMEVVKSGTLESVGSVVLVLVHFLFFSNLSRRTQPNNPSRPRRLIISAGGRCIQGTTMSYLCRHYAYACCRYAPTSPTKTTQATSSLCRTNFIQARPAAHGPWPSQTPKGAALSGSTIPVTGLFVLFLSLVADAATVLA